MKANKEQNEKVILLAHNMVAIESVILSDVWAQFSEKYASDNGFRNPKTETQSEWIKKVNKEIYVEMQLERIRLFNLIPDRFKICAMYKSLENRIFDIKN